MKALDIDDAAEEELFRKKDDFRLDNDEREKVVGHLLERLRHVVDYSELEDNSRRRLLSSGRTSEYRVYHASSTQIAAKHQVAVDEEHTRCDFLLADRFGLVPPTDFMIPIQALVEPAAAPSANATIPAPPHFLLKTRDR